MAKLKKEAQEQACKMTPCDWKGCVGWVVFVTLAVVLLIAGIKMQWNAQGISWPAIGLYALAVISKCIACKCYRGKY